MTTSNMMRHEFVLFGPHAGKTVMVGSHVFDDGVCVITAAPDTMIHVQNMLRRYQAYPRGSIEYQEAMRHGFGREVYQDAGSGATEQVSGHDEPTGGGPAEGTGVHVGSGDDTGSGGTGVGADGDGQDDPGIPEPTPMINPRLGEAIMRLDPTEDSHWTRAGLPAMAAVEEALGKGDFTRADVAAALPDWNRERALAELGEADLSAAL